MEGAARVARSKRRRRGRRRPYSFELSAFLDDFYRALAEFGALRDTGSLVRYPGGTSQDHHELIIRILRRHHDEPLSWLCRQDVFVEMLYDTLRAWGVGMRGSRLVDSREFARRVRRLAASSAFERLAHRRIVEVRGSTAWRSDLSLLWKAMTGPCRIMASTSVFVGSTKLLHHLLPDLVPPMDRAYTLSFLSALDGRDPESIPFRVTAKDRAEDELGIFWKGMQFAGYVARARPGVRDFQGRGPMSGSIPKLIDNAVIAWWQSE